MRNSSTVKSIARDEKARVWSGEECAKRETREESGIEINEAAEVGIIEFEFSGNPEILEVHIFKSSSFSGEPIETEEMRPEWFPVDKIPFEKMWPDDKYWLPLLLSGKKFRGKFVFDGADIILKQELAEI